MQRMGGAWPCRGSAACRGMAKYTQIHADTHHHPHSRGSCRLHVVCQELFKCYLILLIVLYGLKANCSPTDARSGAQQRRDLPPARRAATRCV